MFPEEGFPEQDASSFHTILDGQGNAMAEPPSKNYHPVGFQALVVGDSVTVGEAVKSQFGIVMPEGTQGTILAIDGDGDAQIDFSSIGKHWISKNDVQKLNNQKQDTSTSASTALLDNSSFHTILDKDNGRGHMNNGQSRSSSEPPHPSSSSDTKEEAFTPRKGNVIETPRPPPQELFVRPQGSRETGSFLNYLFQGSHDTGQRGDNSPPAHGNMQETYSSLQNLAPVQEHHIHGGAWGEPQEVLPLPAD